MKKKILFIFVLLSMLFIACSPETLAFDNLPLISDENIYFKDDFSNPKSGWLIENTNTIIKKYSPEGYWIISNNLNSTTWSIPGMLFSDVRIDVSVSKVTGSDDNAFGVLCRYQSGENYYRFTISSDGYYGISKVVNGEEKVLGSEVMNFSYDILNGDQDNHLSAICDGSNLELQVNGIELMSIRDESFTFGDVGLIIENREGDNLAILFNDFKVTKP